MEERQPANGILREQLELVRRLLEESGINQDLISKKSEEAAQALRAFCSVDLPARLSASTVSRMKTGSNIKKLQRKNLILLHLAISYIRTSGAWSVAAAVRASKEAEEFTETVLHAGAAADKGRVRFLNPNDPRHDRIVSLFGSHGVDLLESAIGRNDVSCYRKLANLQLLAGNTDDAHYWNNCANKIAPGMPESLKAERAAHHAFDSGRSYLYNGKGDVAEIYLELAAEAGHADSAFLLGDVLEVQQRDGEAYHWFSKAESCGHTRASVRLASLRRRVMGGPATAL